AFCPPPATSISHEQGEAYGWRISVKCRIITTVRVLSSFTHAREKRMLDNDKGLFFLFSV
ncbi:unnamed protein product, partial [Musa banksii]